MTMLRDIMSPAPACMAPADTVSAAAKVMGERGVGTVRERAVRRIPVLRDGVPVGVISIGDLALETAGSSALSGVQAACPQS